MVFTENTLVPHSFFLSLIEEDALTYEQALELGIERGVKKGGKRFKDCIMFEKGVTLK